jgi:hypothetical protein
VPGPSIRSGATVVQRSRLARARDAAVGFVQDRPGWVAVGLAVLVAVHALFAWWHSWLDPFKALRHSDKDATNVAVTIYLGTAGAAAIVAGLAGVILVFVIGSPSPRLRTFRDAAGRPLQKAWTMMIAEPFSATLLGIIAAITQTTSGRFVAPWLFELAVVLLTHEALRISWLLRELVTLVAADDREATRNEKAIPLNQIFRHGPTH